MFFSWVCYPLHCLKQRGQQMTVCLTSMFSADLYDLISKISPFDQQEKEHRDEALCWIQSGVPLCRMIKPDIPNKHLVSYFVVYDEAERKILLVDHKKAQLWLPTGGHVEPDEHPAETVRRECLEELGVSLPFWMDEPLFITSTITVGLTAGHTDVSLWYVLKGKSTDQYTYDRDEFNDVRWFSFDDISYQRADQHLLRFIEKLRAKSDR